MQFLARNGAYSLYLAADEAALALRDASVLRIRLLGASRGARASGLEELESKSNYLVGRDPSRWRTNVPNFARVKYEGVYPGVDVVYYGNQRQLEYDFDVAAGADADLIRLSVEGADGLRIDEGGDLVLPTAAGEVRQRAPHAYQEVAGVRQTIACRYVLKGGGRVGFELGDYDKTLPLVIDPVVSYSTYLGGRGYDEATSVAVDAEGNAYIAGATSSYNLPVTPEAYQTRRRGSAPNQMVYDAFVAKLNPEGTALVYSTYLGGGGDENGAHLALGMDGEVYVGGQTFSADYPVTQGAFRTQPGSTDGYASDGFVTKLMPLLNTGLIFSTYLGGAGFDHVEGLAVSTWDDSVYVTGTTQSDDFPVTPNALRTSHATGGSTDDAFVTRLNAAGTAAIFSTYLGGEGADSGRAVAVDADGAAYVAGLTHSQYFPITPGVFQPEPAGGGDVFVTKLLSNGQRPSSPAWAGTRSPPSTPCSGASL